MGATTGLARQEDGFDKLLKLASLNAKDIASAGEEHRRQIQLNQEEESRVKEARDYIAKYALLVADLERRENELAESIRNHTEDKEVFAKYRTTENQRLETLAANIDEKDRVSTANSNRAEQALKDAANLKIEYERQHNQAMADIRIAESVNIEIGKKCVAEENRLKEWEATLKAKAERIRQQAASF